MRSTRGFCLVFLAGLFLPSTTLGTDRFVNPDGLCDGSLPCYATVQAAVDASADGDAIEVQTDAEYAEAVTIVGLANLTLRHRDGDAPTLTNTLSLEDTPSFTLDGVNLDAGNDAILAEGNVDGLRLQDAVIHAGKDGLDVNSCLNDAVIDGMTFFSVGEDAIEITEGGADIIVRNNRFLENNRSLRIDGGDCPTPRDITIEDNCFLRTTSQEHMRIVDADGVNITGNFVTESDQQGLYLQDSTNVLLDHNTFVRNRFEQVLLRDSDAELTNNILQSQAAAPPDAPYAGLAVEGAASVLDTNNVVFGSGAETERATSSEYTLWDVATTALTDPAFLDPLQFDRDPPCGGFGLACASPGLAAATTGDNIGADQNLTLADCVDCAAADTDGDGVDDCTDIEPYTEESACVDEFGSKVPNLIPVFGFGAEWAYDNSGVDPDITCPDWRSLGLLYDPACNGQGPAPAELGFGDGDEATTITESVPNDTYYFSREFTIVDAATHASLTLSIVYDDGYAIWVNGELLAKSSSFPDGDPLHGALMEHDTEQALDQNIVVPMSLLVEGTNVIAVQVHQEQPGSSDISFDMRAELAPMCATTGCFDINVMTIDTLAGSESMKKIEMRDGTFSADFPELADSVQLSVEGYSIADVPFAAFTQKKLDFELVLNAVPKVKLVLNFDDCSWRAKVDRLARVLPAAPVVVPGDGIQVDLAIAGQSVGGGFSEQLEPLGPIERDDKRYRLARPKPPKSGASPSSRPHRSDCCEPIESVRALTSMVLQVKQSCRPGCYARSRTGPILVDDRCRDGVRVDPTHTSTHCIEIPGEAPYCGELDLSRGVLANGCLEVFDGEESSTGRTRGAKRGVNR